MSNTSLELNLRVRVVDNDYRLGDHLFLLFPTELNGFKSTQIRLSLNTTEISQLDLDKYEGMPMIVPYGLPFTVHYSWVRV